MLKYAADYFVFVVDDADVVACMKEYFPVVTFLGQVCFLFEHKELKFLVDPYFTNSVAEKENPEFTRMVPIMLNPEQLDDIAFVLITHAHRDHCDIDTLLPLSVASPQCQFYGPEAVVAALLGAGVCGDRVHLAGVEPITASGVEISVVPSAHPKVEPDCNGGWREVGYVFNLAGTVFYHPGDTAVTAEVIEAVKSCTSIDVGLLPVNEINYYRNQQGIIGNMSVREAFHFAEELGMTTVIPTHWDMFAENQVYKEELELLYDRIAPDFELIILDAGSIYAG
ncbi:MAG: MBL fold metallo-hydrolase [Oceanicoccus sp.]